MPAHQCADTVIETDVAIVGAGASGLSLAASLNRDLVVVESGGHGPDMKLQYDHYSVISGRRINPDAVRVRAIGGATTKWTGRCIELDDYDFEDRPWIARSGWPIARSELASWYDAAWKSLMVERGDDEETARRHGLDAAGCAEHGLAPCVWWYSYRGRRKYLRLGDHYGALFDQPSKRLVYHADVVGLVSEGARVQALTIVDRSGRSILVKARQFVLAGNTIDNIKLLLNERRQSGALLGGVDQWLGRGFMQHLRVDCGTLKQDPRQFRSLQQRLNRFPRNGRGFHEVGLGIRPDQARDRQLGNASAYFNYTPGWRRFSPRKAVHVLPWAMGRGVIFPEGDAQVVIDCEQELSESSRVTLDHEDIGPHGIPCANVHWTIGDTDLRTNWAMIGNIAGWLQKQGLGRVELAEGVAKDAIDESRILDSNHPLGGTRMSGTAQAGVVDRHCRVHGTANLHVLGGSVFATGGHGNPTLTMVALAHRLGHHLSETGSVERVGG